MSFKKIFLVLLLSGSALFSLGATGIGVDSLYKVGFSYDGKAFDPEVWSCERVRKDGEVMEIRYVSPDGKLGLTVTYRTYRDFPVTEVRPVLECLSSSPTAIVDDFQSLVFSRGCSKTGAKVRRVTGSQTAWTDFSRHDVLMQDRHECNRLVTSSMDGRSFSWIPYFGVDFDSRNGAEFAVGWTGTWRAEMLLKEQFSMTLGIGERTHFKMLPGERFQMPYVVIYERRDKSVDDGLAEFRRFIIAHKSPRDSKGQLMETILALTASGGNKTDENMLKIMKKGLKTFDIPFNTFWVDAGWYGPDELVSQDTNCGPVWYVYPGDWHPNRALHPDGNLKKISDAAHKAGMKFLLWFEPERTTVFTKAYKEHPDYFLNYEGNTNDYQRLIDFSNPEAFNWIVEELSRNIRESGVDIYRQDFNMNPIEFWMHNDEADRMGVSEIKHINGLYAMWDELHRRFPDMGFENCAGGGTRMDIEMMSRAHSYCRDDAQMQRNHESMIQNITLNSTSYIPFTGGETFAIDVFDSYGFLSCLGAGIVFTPSDFNGMFLTREPSDEEVKWFNEMFTIADRVRPLFYGDFYPLTHEAFDGPDIYCAYQLNKADEGEGFFLIFRREECPEPEFDLRLKGIDPEAVYTVEQFEGQTVEMKGAELMKQTLSFSEPRSYKMVFYKKK